MIISTAYAQSAEGAGLLTSFTPWVLLLIGMGIGFVVINLLKKARDKNSKRGPKA